jgi:hypothetical protein
MVVTLLALRSGCALLSTNIIIIIVFASGTHFIQLYDSQNLGKQFLTAVCEFQYKNVLRL